jgi:hypothetical protein
VSLVRRSVWGARRQQLVSKRASIVVSTLLFFAVVSDKTKHIALKYHFVKDHVERGTICLRYLPIADMVVDTLTMPLPGPVVTKHTQALLGTSGVMSTHTSSPYSEESVVSTSRNPYLVQITNQCVLTST